MPARKPLTLITRDETLDAKQHRRDAESAMTPRTTLTLKPPPALKGHKPAADVWRRVVGLYAEIDGTIATGFDYDLLIKYCLLEEECDWLAGIRASIDKQHRAAAKKLAKARPDDMDAYYKAMGQLNALLTRLQGFDARLDGKRKLLHDLSKSLYLTPRSRAGVAPPTKEPDEPKSEMESLL